MSAETVLSAFTGAAAALTAFLQWRSIKARRELEQWLYEHAAKEERATQRIEEKHDELRTEVRNMTPTRYGGWRTECP